MLEQIGLIFVKNFSKYGLEGIGYLIMAFCFGMFFLRSTQKRRFHFISAACYILSIAYLCQLALPALEVFNPNFVLSEKEIWLVEAGMVCLGTSFLWASLFVVPLSMGGLLRCALFFFVAQGMTIYFTQPLFPVFNFLNWLLIVCWIVMGISFHFLKTVGKTSLFDVVGDAFFVLALYYMATEFDLVKPSVWLPVVAFGGVSFVVLMAQIKFMEGTCLMFEANLEKEKERRTLFWDIAPFPILVSKLLNDAVLYINPSARSVLHVSPNETSQFRLKDYFSNISKRDELIAQARSNKIVEHFVVQMKSPRTQATMWLNLSARVVELDGELARYMNLQDITNQKQTEEKLFQEASTDALTGLYNRRQFEAMCGMALANCIRQKTPYSMMMLDIDHFKNVNDTYGHDMGDVVLKNIAAVLRQTGRDSDIIARYGGEEFIIFLNNTDVEGAKIAAERIRSAVEQAVITTENGERIPVTISLGVTASQSGDIYAMAKEADIALYHSKENGRNRATVFTAEMRNETGGNT